jgi:predicted flap endonuclease-1-like 5' DNA nuclease
MIRSRYWIVSTNRHGGEMKSARGSGIGLALLSAGALLVGCSGSQGEASRTAGLPWWGWLLIIIAIIVVVWLIWRCLRRRGARAEAEPRVPEIVADAEKMAPATAADMAADEPVEPDDLKVIEGIGPKVASLLAGVGILTFAQLAAADLAQIRELLESNRLQMIEPASWPDQAALAAEGRWEELEALQDALKGGRRE